MQETSRRIRCFAKVNLGLRVAARRPDGFHELRTVLHTIDLHDSLEIHPARTLSLKVRYEGPAVGMPPLPEGEENLVLRAARAAGAGGGAFVLTKRIPHGAGLGGGSSDAAAVLLALSDGPPGREAYRWAASLGSDVPFFLAGGAGLALGRGEAVYPLRDARELHLVLAFSEQPLSTLEVYDAWDELLTSPRNPGKLNDFAPWSLGRGDEVPGVANDLEEAAIRIRPSLKHLRSTLERSGAQAVAMTGSGSTFFGIFGDGPSAQGGLQHMVDAGFSGVTARTIGREERDRLLWQHEGSG